MGRVQCLTTDIDFQYNFVTAVRDTHMKFLFFKLLEKLCGIILSYIRKKNTI